MVQTKHNDLEDKHNDEDLDEIDDNKDLEGKDNDEDLNDTDDDNELKGKDVDDDLENIESIGSRFFSNDFLIFVVCRSNRILRGNPGPCLLSVHALLGTTFFRGSGVSRLPARDGLVDNQASVFLEGLLVDQDREVWEVL